jgi:23S rRNA (guanosine2251-2'-O)-methyltransferase
VLTVFGRKPVLEALTDPSVEVERVLLDRTTKGAFVRELEAAAATRGVDVTRVAPEKVTRVSGNGRHDQGVVAEVLTRGIASLDAWLAGRAAGPVSLVVLDGVTNPSNVGMVLRTVTAAGIDGVVLPEAGSPDLGPLVVKASAGVAFRATVLQAASPATAIASLRAAGVTSVGLRGGDAADLFRAPLPERAAFVLGNETHGVSVACDQWRSIPMAGGVESLNVAVAAGIVAYELVRRRTP